jgi:membrane-bound metal-dependent hydrolase YbcI (DUF457 family)
MLIRSRNRDRSRGGSVALSSLATGYLNGVTPYHYADFITNRMLYAGADVGNVTQATGYSFTRASQGYYTNSDGTLTNFASGALRRGDRGVLIEGSRTNLCLQSQTFDNASWGKNNCTVTANQYVAPDGTTTMDMLTAAAGNSSKYLLQAITPTAAIHTASVFAKYVNHQFLQVSFFDGTTARIACFDLLNGTAGATANCTNSIQSVSGGYRCTVIASGALLAAAGNMVVGMVATNTASNVPAWTAAGTEAIGIWGYQFEAASFPSSYIPTVAAAATRASDVLSYTVNTTAQIQAAVAGQAELVTDPSFDNGLTDWTVAANTNASVTGGQLRVWRTDSTSQRVYATLTGLTIGQTYAVFCDVLTATGTPTLRVASNTNFIAGLVVIDPALSVGTNRFLFVANATTMYVGVTAASDPGAPNFDNISVKEVPANSLTLYPLSLWAEFERIVGTDGATSQGIVNVYNTTSNDSSQLMISTALTLRGVVSSTAGGGSQVDVASGAVALGTHKAAMRVLTNDWKSALNGTLVGSDASMVYPAQPAGFEIGVRPVGNSPLFGMIRRIAVFNSALTDAQLQTTTS